jgi:diguanylate cyclase (GGDEF)-like protein
MDVHRTVLRLEKDKQVFDSQNMRGGFISLTDVQRLLLIVLEARNKGEMTTELQSDIRKANDMLYVRANSFYTTSQSEMSFPSPDNVARSMLRMVDTIDAATAAGFPDIDETLTTLLVLAEESRKDLVRHLDRMQRVRFDLLSNQLAAVTKKRNVVWATLTCLMLFAISTLILLRWEILSSNARQRAEARIRHLAFYDSLTGLNNRSGFQEQLGAAFHRGKPITLMMLDVDEFKSINDTYGHAAGDQILLHIGQVLQGIAQKHDGFVARLGGDEFALIVSQTDIDYVKGICDEILKQVQTLLTIEGEEIAPRISIGLATSTQVSDTLQADGEAVLRAADFALYAAKSAGRRRYTIYDEALARQFLIRRKMVEDLPAAIAKGEMEIFLQPKVRLATSEIYGFEALVRWRRDGVIVPPSQFIATAEESGQIIDLDRSVLRQACRIVADFNRNNNTRFSISVNFSALQFNSNRCCAVVQGVLLETGLSPDLLTIEVTETVELSNLEQAKCILKELQSTGVRIAIDDFGAGFSSLAYLRNTFANEIKIDRSLVIDLETSSSSQFLLDSVIEIAHNLGLEVTVEGVEDQSQLQIVRAMGPKNGQGFLWSKPVPAREALQMAIENQSDDGLYVIEGRKSA